MKPIPNKIIVRVTLEDGPLQGVLFNATFGMTSKNSYNVILGPSDAQGKASLDQETILRKAQELHSLATMEYVPIESGYSGEVTVEPLSEEGINNAIKTYELFKKSSSYPPGWKMELEKALTCPYLDRVEEFKIEVLTK